MAANEHQYPDYPEFKRQLVALLGPESSFYRVILVYSCAISLLTLAIPISVQILIDTIANVGVLSAVVTIGLLLFALLLVSGVLYALRAWTMELWNRRLLARIGSEMAMTALLARIDHFEHERRAALFNRFFDIMTLKKNVPYLLSYGFSLFFQTVIGFVVVSLYHFYFLLFSLVLILLILLVWRLWGWQAIRAGFRLSEAKHDTAAWLQGLACNNGFYKARHRMTHALARTDAHIHRHLDLQEQHFRFAYRQLLSFLLIYAVASATLLMMGGWLVIQGQLSLGQLVAAELILSAIFYGLPQMAAYLDYLYDACAAIEEIHRFAAVDTEKPAQGSFTGWENGGLELRNLHASVAGRELSLSMSLPAGLLLRASGEDAALEQIFAAILQREISVTGSMRLGEADLRDCDLRDLRQYLLVLDRPHLLPLTIREYLQLADPLAGSAKQHEVLTMLGLDAELRSLPAGLDTCLAHGGQPLRLQQALCLKLAFVLLSPARVLVLNQLFDCLSPALMQAFMAAWRAKQDRILLYFTARTDLPDFDGDLLLACQGQQLLARHARTPDLALE